MGECGSIFILRLSVAYRPCVLANTANSATARDSIPSLNHTRRVEASFPRRQRMNNPNHRGWDFRRPDFTQSRELVLVLDISLLPNLSHRKSSASSANLVFFMC